ncbi:MAG: twin-arginine translocase TatA/TatE family subunit [Archaeoglobaceae archaeon]
MIPGGFGPNELILILIVAFLLFGASKLPQLARSMGKSMGEFKRAQREAEIELQEFEKDVKEGKHKTKERREKIEKMARDMGIEDIEGKTEEELLEEIRNAAPKESAEP